MLLNNFGVLNWDWRMTGRLWPMVLVMWGISALRISEGAKKTIIIVAVILTGFLLVGFSHGIPWPDRGWYRMSCPWY